MSCTLRMAQDVRVFVSYHPCMKRAFLLTSFFITFIFLKTTSSRNLCRVPHRDHDRATVPRATVPRGRGLRRCHNQRDAHSQCTPRTSLSLPARRPVCWSVVVRVREIVASGQELNVEHAQMRTLLDRQREQILADCQAEIRRHKFQADYDRRSTQKLSGTIESQKEELHRVQAEGLHRRDQQLLHEQLLKQNWDLREAHEKSLKKNKEMKKFL